MFLHKDTIRDLSMNSAHHNKRKEMKKNLLLTPELLRMKSINS